MVAMISALFSNSNVKPPTSARSTARAALAAAIAEASEAQRKSDDARTAIPRAAEMVAQAQARLAEATEAVVAAKAAQAARMATAASSGATLAPDGGMRDARARQTDCEDELDAARDAQAAVEAAATAAHDRVIELQTGIPRAARGVIVSAIDPAKAIALRAELDARTQELTTALNVELAVLRFANHNALGDNPRHSPSDLPPTSDEFKQIVRNILDKENRIFDTKIQQPIADLWSAAFAALCVDPDAPLPI
jgi:hypothetical protein